MRSQLSLPALADPTRRRIIELLASGERASGEIAERFAISAPAVSQHLKTLKQAGLVRSRVEAQRRIYELDPSASSNSTNGFTPSASFGRAASTRGKARLAHNGGDRNPYRGHDRNRRSRAGREDHTMTDDGQLERVPMIRFERLLTGPIERVWEFLTHTSQLPGWFGDGTIEPRPGGAVDLMGGQIRGMVVQWKPPRRLAYTWNVCAPGDEESRYPESYLTLELEPRGKEVLLTLTHLPVLERFEKQNAMGWHTFLDMLGAALRGEAPEPRAVHMKRNAARYGVDLSNLAK